MSVFFCLQFSPYSNPKNGHNDEMSALYLARLIADNEPDKRFDVEFGISYRPDSSSEIVQEIEHTLRQKFHNFYSHKSTRTGKGWPHGCNDLWFDTMSWAYDLRRSGEIKSTGILTFESDNLPLKRDWIDILKNEWREHSKGKLAVGNVWNDPFPHVNGNGIFFVRMQEKLGSRMHGCAAHKPWDLHMAKWILPKSHDTNELTQIYNGEIKDLYELAAVKKNGHRPALLHGPKGIKHLELAKRFLSLTPKQLAEYEKGHVESRKLPEVTKAMTVAVAKADPVDLDIDEASDSDSKSENERDEFSN